MHKWHIATAAAALIAAPALAQDATTYDFDGSFDDATFALESAIVGQGLVVDYVVPYRRDAGAYRRRCRLDVKLFDAADIFLFCSAVVSRKVMEADLGNIAHCPYSIFVTDVDGAVQIGYRNMPDGPMQEVQTLLDGIAREAAGQ